MHSEELWFCVHNYMIMLQEILATHCRKMSDATVEIYHFTVGKRNYFTGYGIQLHELPVQWNLDNWTAFGTG